MEHKSTEDLLDLHKRASDAYYSSGDNILTDEDFNALEAVLESRNALPSKVQNTQTTYGEVYGEKYTHKTPMLSLRKVNVVTEDEMLDEQTHAEIVKNMKRSSTYDINDTFQMDFKSDGLAINAIYENHELVAAVTRGDDGLEGRNVIEKVRDHLPSTVRWENIEIRYECIMRVDTFVEKYSNEYSHPRNLASGILSDESLTDTRKNDLILIPLYGIENGQFLTVTELGNGVDNRCDKLYTTYVTKEDLEDFSKFEPLYREMMENRPTMTYPTDGLVLSSRIAYSTDYVNKYPNHSLSIKFPPKGAKTTVKGLEWNLKKSGEYTPIVLLDPVIIDGRKITRCHGFNISFIRENGIEKGAEVFIQIAGDIIPYLAKVIKPSDTELVLPKDTIEKGCHLLTTNADLIKVEKFIYGALKLGLKDFGESFYRSVAEYYDYDPFNIIDTRYTCDDIILIGVSRNKLEKLQSRIADLKTMKLKDIIVALAIDHCGEGTSEQVAKYLAKHEYNINEGYDVNYDFTQKRIAVVESCTKGMHKNIIMETVGLLQDIGIEVEYAEKIKVVEGGIKKIIMTGSPKKFDFATKAVFKKHLGDGHVETKKMQEADFLITDNLESTSSKMKAAKKHGVEIRTYGQF